MREDMVLSIIHPETYFFDREGKDDLAFPDDKVALLQAFVSRCMSEAIPIHVHYSLGISSSELTKRLIFMASGLDALIPGKTSSYSSLRSLYTFQHAVPLRDEFSEHVAYRDLQKKAMEPLIETEYHRMLFPYRHAVHLLAGGFLSRCLANYARYTSEKFPSSRLFYIDELCVSVNAEETVWAQERLFGIAEKISFSDALTLLSQ